MNSRPTPVGNNNVEHFSKMTRERDAFVQTADTKNRQAQDATKRIEQLRAQKRLLQDQVQTTQSSLGVSHRELDMWQNEAKRLQKMHESERVEIQQCVEESKALETDDGKRKHAFYKMMEALNAELADLLAQQDDIRLMKMLGGTTAAHAVLEHFQKEKVIQAMGESQEARASSLECLQTAIDTVKATTASFLSALARKKALMAIVQVFRARVLEPSNDASNEPPTQANLMEMERYWENNDNGERSNNNNNGGTNINPTAASLHDAASPHMMNLDLFYGSQSDHAGGVSSSTAMDQASESAEETKAEF